MKKIEGLSKWTPQTLVFMLIFILIIGAMIPGASITYVFAIDGAVEDDTNAGPPPPVEDDN